MAETRARPGKAIPPPPVFKAYKTFTYAAASLRAPFDRPLEVEQRVRASQGQAVQPDLERSPEFLERFALDSLSLVGSLAMGDRKSTRLNSSHVAISYAVFCLKKQ